MFYSSDSAVSYGVIIHKVNWGNTSKMGIHSKVGIHNKMGKSTCFIFFLAANFDFVKRVFK